MSKIHRLPRAVPWASPEEWRCAWALFYAPDPDTTRRKRAVKMVKAWRSRGTLPHAVDATCELVDTMLADLGAAGGTCGGAPDEAQLRQLYALAITRLVNGLTDQAQTSSYARSVAHVARDLDLPHWFVELRHMATHARSLPPLGVLRAAAARAVAWLDSHYWQRRAASHGDRGPRIDASLQAHLGGGRQQQDLDEPTGGEPAWRAILAVLPPGSSGVDALLGQLCTCAWLYSAPHPAAASSAAAFDRRWATWRLVLKRLHGQHPDTAARLVAAVISSVGSLGESPDELLSLDGAPGVKATVLLAMLERILGDAWVAAQTVFEHSSVRAAIGNCLLHAQKSSAAQSALRQLVRAWPATAGASLQPLLDHGDLQRKATPSRKRGRDESRLELALPSSVVDAQLLDISAKVARLEESLRAPSGKTVEALGDAFSSSDDEDATGGPWSRLSVDPAYSDGAVILPSCAHPHLIGATPFNDSPQLLADHSLA